MNLNISIMNSSLVLASLVVAAVLASEFDEARLVFRGEAREGEGQPRPRQFRFSDPVRLGGPLATWLTVLAVYSCL